MKFRTFAATITAILLAFPLTAADIPELVPTISVSGTAEVTMYPDTAEFTITASFTEDTTEEAREKTSEMINTAIEALVNLGTSSYDNVARVAKDVAAGAVFLTALMSLVVGCVLLIKPDKLSAFFRLLLEQPLLILPFLFLVVVGPLFIFFGLRLKKQK